MISPNDIVRALGGRWTGKKARCRCPVTVHSSDKTPLAVAATRDGRPLVKCWAGCSQEEVISALRSLGLWAGGHTIDPSYPAYATMPHDRAVFDSDDRKARDEAEAIWIAAKPIEGTQAEAYLKARGIRNSRTVELRFAPHLRHTPANRRFPAMVARISDNRGFCAVQRTFLDESGSPKKAEVKPAKMTRGPMGNGAVRLRSVTGDVLGLAEGIETALSAAQLYSMPVWATLSAMRLNQIEIPEGVRFLHVFGDPGEVGRKEAFKAADEYELKGYHVEVYFPEAHFRAREGKDFNDVVREGAPRI